MSNYVSLYWRVISGKSALTITRQCRTSSGERVLDILAESGSVPQRSNPGLAEDQLGPAVGDLGQG